MPWMHTAERQPSLRIRIKITPSLFDKFPARDRRQLCIWPPTSHVKSIPEAKLRETKLMAFKWLLNKLVLLALFILTDQLSRRSIDAGGVRKKGRFGFWWMIPSRAESHSEFFLPQGRWLILGNCMSSIYDDFITLGSNVKRDFVFLLLWKADMSFGHRVFQWSFEQPGNYVWAHGTSMSGLCQLLFKLVVRECYLLQEEFVLKTSKSFLEVTPFVRLSFHITLVCESEQFCDGPAAQWENRLQKHLCIYSWQRMFFTPLLRTDVWPTRRPPPIQQSQSDHSSPLYHTW